MKRLRRTVAGLSFTALLAALALPVAAQSVQPAPIDHDHYFVPDGEHFHAGPIGRDLMTVETNLKCNCGSCSLDIHSCQFQMQCGTSPLWSQLIRESLEAGYSPEAVQASFVQRYGTSVLMAPPAEGFNLVGYLLPGVGIITMGMLIGLIVRGNSVRSQTAAVTELDSEDEERLREALRKLDEEESPDW